MYTVFNIGIIAALFACAFATYPLQGKMFSRLLWLDNVWMHSQFRMKLRINRQLEM